MRSSMRRKGKKRARAAPNWCNDEEGHLLLPGLDVDIALRCLAFLPSYFYPFLACLNKTYRSLIISAKCAPLMQVRRSLGIVDHLLVSEHVLDLDNCECETVLVNREEHIQAPIKASLRVLDLKRNTWMNLSVPRYLVWRRYDTFFCSGTCLFCCSYSLLDPNMHYDFATNRWEIRHRMQEPTRRWCAFAANEDCCFAAGGHNTNGVDLSFGFALRTAEIYNMHRSSWRRLPSMLAPRDKCAGFIMDNKFYVIGGTDGRFSSYADAEEYDPSTKVWKSIPNMCLNASMDGRPLVAVHKNQLYAIDDRMSIPSNPSLHVYEKQTKTWRCLGTILDRHGQGDLHVRDEGLISIRSEKLVVVGEWRPRTQEEERKTYVLAWEPFLEATACEFKIVYSGPAELDMFEGVWDDLLEQQQGRQERQFRLPGKAWLAVVI